MKRVGYTGSYARDDWGFGSDVDLIVIVEHAGDPLARGMEIDANSLPVPADVMVFTSAEWSRMKDRRLGREPVVWLNDPGKPVRGPVASGQDELHDVTRRDRAGYPSQDAESDL